MHFPCLPRTRLRLPALAVLAALVLTPLPAPGAAARPPAAAAVGDRPAAVLPGRLVVTVTTPGVALEAAAAELDGDVTPLGGRVRLVRVPAGTEGRAATALRGVPGVTSVEPDRLRAFATTRPDDPLFERQWTHELAHAGGAWDHTIGSRRVRVALVDSGVRGDHPDLTANVVEQVDLSGGTPVPRETGVDNDTCDLGHGTQVAGVVGAVGGNAEGGTGVAWKVGIVDLAVSSTATPGSCEGASDSAILAALHYATHHPDGAVDVVNLSVGGRQAYCPEAYEQAVADARGRGVLVVAAAGNSGVGTAQVPASCPGVVAVGAVGRDGLRAPYSASNPWVDLVAPGGTDLGGREGLVLTTGERGDWVRTQGTSFAAPYVTGVAALMRSIKPYATPDEMESILERSAEPAPAGRTDDLGWGRVRADRAVSYLVRRRLVPEPVPDPWFPVLRLEPRPAGPGPVRVAAGTERTMAVHQAAAVSRTLFREGGAVHAVVARTDHFADGLAGSALGMGVGPLLFNAPGEDLEPQNLKELRRALPEGARVYLLGGEAGVSPRVGRELGGMGYDVVRLEGATREETAARVAREIHRIRRRSGMGPVPEIILVTRDDWPDAVTAGQLAAREGTPVLLTPSDGLHPAAAEALADLRPGQVTVVGSPSRVSDHTALAAQEAAGGARLLRLAGATRHETSAQVALEALRRLDGRARVLVAVNVARADAYAHALSAALLTGAYGGAFVTVEGPRGRRLSDASADVVASALQTRGDPADLLGVVAGGEDVLAASAAQELERLLKAR